MCNFIMDSEDETKIFIIRHEYRDKNMDILSLKEKYSDFSEKYPKLFGMICSTECDDNMLNKMLSAKRLVNSGSMSQHDASVQVGKDLVDKYVIPKLDGTNN